MVMKGKLTPVKRGMLQCKKSGGFGDTDTDVLIPPCSMQFVLSFSKVKGHIKDGTRRKRLLAPENFLLGLRCEKKREVKRKRK